jgi:hypothetical protein
MVWNGNLPTSFEPYVQQPAGDPVWVDYEMNWKEVCPVCGAYSTSSLELRNGEGGKVRFLAQDGVVLPALSDARVMDLFGAAAQAVPSCSFAATAGCTTFDRTQYDHLLLTTPTQMIDDATWGASVDTPNGKYHVYWASSTETTFPRNVTTCTDGPGVATDNGFIAALVAP